MDKLESDVAAGTFPAVSLKALVERVCADAQTELAELCASAPVESDATK